MNNTFIVKKHLENNGNLSDPQSASQKIGMMLIRFHHL